MLVLRYNKFKHTTDWNKSTRKHTSVVKLAHILLIEIIINIEAYIHIWERNKENIWRRTDSTVSIASDHIMLIGSNLNSDFGPLPSAPWNMEPPRMPLSTGSGSLSQSTNLQLSPTGKQNYIHIHWTSVDGIDAHQNGNIIHGTKL